MRFTLLLTGAACAMLGLSSPALAQGKAKQPHILFLLLDDLGYTDVGFNGGDIKTPNIDKLAKSGAKLSSFYVQPV